MIQIKKFNATDKEFREKYKNLRLYFVPEFLRERCATEDFIYNHNTVSYTHLTLPTNREV